MGDTYDNVKSDEDKFLLMNRAKFIDGCEAGMTSGTAGYSKCVFDSHMNHSTMYATHREIIKKYVHVLSKKEGADDEEDEHWGGRLRAIDSSVK